MENVSNLINKNIPHVTTNTILFIIVAIIAFYILIKVVSKVIKIIAVLIICWFLLMSVQSTNLANIPIVKQAYNTVNKFIPSKELWTKASSYVNKADKMINDFKDSK